MLSFLKVPIITGVRVTDVLGDSLSFTWNSYQGCDYAKAEYTYELRSSDFGLLHIETVHDPRVRIDNLMSDTEYLFRVAVTAFYSSDTHRNDVWKLQWTDFLTTATVSSAEPTLGKHYTTFKYTKI